MTFRNNLIKLHFEHLYTKHPEPLKLIAHQNKFDFIQYLINSEHPTLPQEAFNQYLREKQPLIQIPSHESRTSLERKKLKILFSHLASFHGEFLDLEIEPLCLADLIIKFNDINAMSDEEVSLYLSKFMEKRIPDYAELPLEEFLIKIRNLYQKDGFNFHSYLRENFFKTLVPQEIREPESLLNYFMPKVFSQRHINSCSIATTLTNLKKTVTNFNELQNLCFQDQKLPLRVQKSRAIIKELEFEFYKALKNSSTDNKKLTYIYQTYFRNLEIIQTYMENKLLPVFTTPAVKPRLNIKKYQNFALSLIHYLVTKRRLPAGFDLCAEKCCSLINQNMSNFQQRITKKNLLINISKSDILKNANKSIPSNSYLEDINTLFLSGQLTLEAHTPLSAHALIINLDEKGDLYFIEHKNGKMEKFLVEPHALKIFGIKMSANYKAHSALLNLESQLTNLGKEHAYLLKERASCAPDSDIYEDLNRIVEVKEKEIKDLLKVKSSMEQIPNSPVESKKYKFHFHALKNKPKEIHSEPENNNSSNQNILDRG